MMVALKSIGSCDVLGLEFFLGNLFWLCILKNMLICNNRWKSLQRLKMCAQRDLQKCITWSKRLVKGR
jgi:hypothetical protein